MTHGDQQLAERAESLGRMKHNTLCQPDLVSLPEVVNGCLSLPKMRSIDSSIDESIGFSRRVAMFLGNANNLGGVLLQIFVLGQSNTYLAANEQSPCTIKWSAGVVPIGSNAVFKFAIEDTCTEQRAAQI